MKIIFGAFIIVGLWSGTMADSKETEYTNTWLAEIHGGEEVAQRVARDLGYTYKSKAEPFEDHYVFTREDHPEVSKRNSLHLTANLLDLDEVKWAEQQAIVQRSKRGIVPDMLARQYQEKGANEDTLLNEREVDSGSSSNHHLGSTGAFYNTYGGSMSSSVTETTLNENAVIFTVNDSDSAETIYDKVNSKISGKKIGGMILCNAPIVRFTLIRLNSKFKQFSWLSNGNGLPQTSVSSCSETDYSAINSKVKEFENTGRAGNGKVVVVFVKDGSGTGSTEMPARQHQEQGNKITRDAGSGSQVSSGSDPSKSSATKPTNDVSSGSVEKVVVVNIDKTDSISNDAIAKLGSNKKVGAIIISAGSLDSNGVQNFYTQLALNDKLGVEDMEPMSLSGPTGGPVGTGSIFFKVNELMTEGKLNDNNVAVVITKGDSIDLNALKEMFKQNDQGDISKLGTFPTQPTDGKEMLSTYQGATKHIACVSQKKSAYRDQFNDPLWVKQWYEQDYRTTNVPVMDLNVVPVYKMGITGQGVTVAVVDDGVTHNHPDLIANFRVDLSYDMVLNVTGSEPSPPNGKDDNSHGTKCAGTIAMEANNGICGVGIAYNAKVGGIKTVGNRVVEFGDAKGMVWKLEHYDIYSNSWGPSDDGLTLGTCGHMLSTAFEQGISQGRSGKGVIYVFSAGNGKPREDNCGYDGLLNHMATIPIAGASQRGKVASYSERCTAIYATTYSAGNEMDESVATTDLKGACTTSFGGTSAAAPIGAGIIALVLQANPTLTYRDVMHIIAMSTEVAPLASNENIWYKNGRGFWVSNDFGFGLMNAENMVLLAKRWVNVENRNTCTFTVDLSPPKTFSVNDDGIIEFETDACQNAGKDSVVYLEQIQLSSTIEYPFRGAISMKITSPAGTTTDILEKRIKDSDPNGFNEWSIKSVHNWGENPKGKWKIVVKANSISGVTDGTGTIRRFTLKFHGTVKMPEHYKTPRTYAAFRLPDGKTSE